MIHSIYLENFRNYKERHLTFSPHINWIVGPNAQGKTNLLEAFSLLSTGRSFRTQYLNELIREGASSFYLEVQFEKDGVLQSLALSFDGKSKQMVHNTTRYSHFTPLIGLIPTVLLLPEDGMLTWGAPAYRRRFLNLHIAQAAPIYVQHLARYQKALDQRNALLKRKNALGIEPWEEMMAHSASALMAMRHLACEQLSLPLTEAIRTLSSGIDQLQCAYQSSFPLQPFQELPPFLRKQWEKQRERELYIGSTLMGPHRDDLKLMMGNKMAKLVASEGQKHSIAAAMRLAEWRRLKELTGYSPLFCIDDFGVHLDPLRQTKLQEEIQKLGQVFLTTPVAPQTITNRENLFLLSDKQLKEEKPSHLSLSFAAE